MVLLDLSFSMVSVRRSIRPPVLWTLFKKVWDGFWEREGKKTAEDKEGVNEDAKQKLFEIKLDSSTVISIQEVKHFQEEKRGHDIDKTGADANAKCYSVTQAIG